MESITQTRAVQELTAACWLHYGPGPHPDGSPQQVHAGATTAPTAAELQARTHTLEDVIEGRAPVGVEGRGGLDVAEARRRGLYVEKLYGPAAPQGITAFARDSRAMQPMREFIARGGRYGTPAFSRLLGYSDEEIAAYEAFLRAHGHGHLLQRNAAEAAVERAARTSEGWGRRT